MMLFVGVNFNNERKVLIVIHIFIIILVVCIEVNSKYLEKEQNRLRKKGGCIMDSLIIILHLNSVIN